VPKILLLPGDGIGQEIVPEAVKALKAVGKRFNRSFQFSRSLIGGTAYDECGHPLPESTLKLCQESDAILLGPSEALNGNSFLFICVLKWALCSLCEKSWGFMPTSGRRFSSLT